jgi:hypothetical protein
MSKMTVGKLKEKLDEFDDDTVVFVTGYEGGYHYASIPEEKSKYKLDVEKGKDRYYYGEHEKVGGFLDNLDGEGLDDDKEIVKGICL